MKANELRIGNWITAPKGSRWNGNDIQWSLDNFYWLGELVDDIEDFKPIPLTEEWLVKFGFEYIEHWPNYRIPTNDGYYNSIQLYENEWHYNNDSSDAGCYYVATIKYVHQLQNLYFALTNEELEIENL